MDRKRLLNSDRLALGVAVRISDVPEKLLKHAHAAREQSTAYTTVQYRFSKGIHGVKGQEMVVSETVLNCTHTV